MSIAVFNEPSDYGTMHGLWDVNTVIYTGTVLVANLRLALATRYGGEDTVADFPPPQDCVLLAGLHVGLILSRLPPQQHVDEGAPRGAMDEHSFVVRDRRHLLLRCCSLSCPWC